MRAAVKGRNGESIYTRDLVLTLQKENGRHALILPTQVWRVVSVQNLGLSSQF